MTPGATVAPSTATVTAGIAASVLCTRHTRGMRTNFDPASHAETRDAPSWAMSRYPPVPASEPDGTENASPPALPEVSTAPAMRPSSVAEDDPMPTRSSQKPAADAVQSGLLIVNPHRAASALRTMHTSASFNARL